MPRHVECDDLESVGDGVIVLQGTVLPRIRAGGMQAEQGNALAGGFHVDAMGSAVQVKVQVPAGYSFESSERP